MFCFWCGGSNFSGVGRKEIKEGVGMVMLDEEKNEQDERGVWWRRWTILLKGEDEIENGSHAWLI